MEEARAGEYRVALDAADAALKERYFPGRGYRLYLHPFTVVEITSEMRREGWRFMIESVNDGGWNVSMWTDDHDPVEAHGWSLSNAVVLAAAKAL